MSNPHNVFIEDYVQEPGLLQLDPFVCSKSDCSSKGAFKVC